MLQAERRLAGELDGFGNRKRPQPLDTLPQILTFNKFHYQVGPPIDLVRIPRQHDIGMTEPAGGPHFSAKAFQGLLVENVLLMNRLDSDGAAQPCVPRFEDLAHRAFPKPLEQAIGANDQHLAFVLENLIHLERRQPVAADQLFGEGVAVGEGRRQRAQFFDLDGG